MSKNTGKTVGLISLGCDKNRVDSEKLLASIAPYYKISQDAENCDILIINTCAFLESSRREAIETVFEYAHLKTDGNLEKLIITGCLPQKFIDELFDSLVEVDAFLGTFDGSKILELIDELYKTKKRINWVGKGEELKTERILTTPEHYAYLKIADGCNNHCTYCLIPKIRGRYKSYKMEDLLLEAKNLGDIQELILVAQDTTRYGEDLYGENKFVELIRALSALENVGSIRLLYCYPDKISDALINEFNTNPKLLKYIDIPLQHADDKILKLMNRPGSFDEYVKLIEKLKTQVEGISIRSTFITGFPSETEVEHKRLIEFLKKAKLFNAGFFAYSKEMDTPAFKLSNQVHYRTKLRRQKELYDVQKEISKNNLSKYLNKKIEVVCDGVDYEKQSFFGRAYFSAPDVDGLVYFSSDETINQGDKYIVKITNFDDFDLYGEIENELT
ncbi:MAG: 30S ribosomal protein S12 methylthiotransferase RimO [Clostridia bacterium]|nr:30S ribosomal protein S12 methylthiotransferase RimO [Clostridia bacterium]